MKMGVYSSKIPIPGSSSLDVTWSKIRFSSNTRYIKVVIVSKVTNCLPDFGIITESLWASGGATVVYKTQHIDIMDISGPFY